MADDTQANSEPQGRDPASGSAGSGEGTGQSDADNDTGEEGGEILDEFDWVEMERSLDIDES